MSYDVVFGGGSVGYAAAVRAAQLSMRVALVEGDKLGDTRLHRGCIPTKALRHSVEVADTVRDSHAVDLLSILGSIDMSAVHEFKNGVVGRLYKSRRWPVERRRAGVPARAIRRLSSAWPRFRWAQAETPPDVAAKRSQPDAGTTQATGADEEECTPALKGLRQWGGSTPG